MDNPSAGARKSRIINLEELMQIPKAYAIIEAMGNRRAGRQVDYPYYGFSINTDAVLVIEDKPDMSLTFQMIPDEESPYLQNLILTLEEDGEYSVYFSAYDFKEEVKQKVINNEYIGLTEFSIRPLFGISAPGDKPRQVMRNENGDEVIRKDGKCFQHSLVRTQSYSDIPGQLEFSEITIIEVEVECPKNGGDNGGSSSTEVLGPPRIDPPIRVPLDPAEPWPNPPGGGVPNPGDPKGPPRLMAPVRTQPFYDLIDEASKNRECQKIAAALDLNPLTRQKLAEIAGKVDDPVNEHGFGVMRNGEILDFTPAPALFIPATPFHRYTVISHVHNNPQGGTYSVFSWDDLLKFAELLNHGNINHETFVGTLSTKKGTHYAITINNITKFKDFWYSKFTDIRDVDTYEERQKMKQSYEIIDKVSKKYYGPKGLIQEENVNNELMLSHFLNFMNESNIGLSVFEADASFQNFSKVDVNSNGSNKRRPCNN